MPGFDYSFAERLQANLLCPMCELPLREPVHIADCDHRFCDSCLQDFLSEGVFQCPVDELPLDYAKIYPDREIQSEIMTSMIRCIHNKEGCRWVDKLNNLQGHLAICRYDAVPCPNDCGAKLSRVCLSDHLKFTCSRRLVTCESCTKEFSGEAMETHQGNCPQEVVYCENKCGARLQKRFLSNHMRNECHKRTVPCPYCKKQFVYETLQNHYYQCPRFPVTCPNRCDPLKIPREEVEDHVQDHCPSAPAPCSFREAGCKYMGPRFNMDRHMETAMKTHLAMMCKLSLTQQDIIEDLTDQLERVTQVSNGVLLWKITDYKNKEAESKTTPNLEYKSKPFYTSQYGYRLSASLFLNGNGSGESTHISLYIRVLQGEYDTLLEWPFRLPISFQLVDQCSDPEKRAHVVESFVPNPSWKHFQMPNKDIEAMGFGYPKFVSLERLDNGTYIKDDAMFIKIKVDTSKFISP